MTTYNVMENKILRIEILSVPTSDPNYCQDELML